jgi:hypothetical protein
MKLTSNRITIAAVFASVALTNCSRSTETEGIVVSETGARLSSMFEHMAPAPNFDAIVRTPLALNNCGDRNDEPISAWARIARLFRPAVVRAQGCGPAGSCGGAYFNAVRTPCFVTPASPCKDFFDNFVQDSSKAGPNAGWYYDGTDSCGGCGCKQAGCTVTGTPPNTCGSGCTDAMGVCMPSCNANDGTGGSSPVIVDVTGDGFHLTSAAAGVQFDFFGSGKKVQISWTNAESDDAFLVLDRNGNGLIDSAKEMFGNITAQPLSQHPNGFLALAEFDHTAQGGNSDGVIDNKDAVFSRLRVWQDKNHNGISEPGELLTLGQVGIDIIGLDYREAKKTDAFGNQFRFRSQVRDSRGAHVGRWAYDVFLVVEP